MDSGVKSPLPPFKPPPTAKRNGKTRKFIGTTNRTSLTPLPAAEPSSPSRSGSRLSHTITPPSPSLSRTTRSIEAKMVGKKVDKVEKERDRLNMDAMKAKFTETFEDGKNTSAVHRKAGFSGEVYPPTRFSGVPHKEDSHEIMGGEPGTSFFMFDFERLLTSKQFDASPDRITETDFQIKSGKEFARGERIRANQARVESSVLSGMEKKEEMKAKHIEAVMKQQQEYEKAIGEREKRENPNKLYF
eukprot:TRINITY_DN2125_c0_g1_i2.p1 TRINITY_DN2125_c0_g1~~TRINITY_DN2125_c0_g1_i2.p1  ORF type:complete len:245 (+),score=64.81 TRINITY_DN2125_c0_g1_i2:99-833(+)